MTDCDEMKAKLRDFFARQDWLRDNSFEGPALSYESNVLAEQLADCAEDALRLEDELREAAGARKYEIVKECR